MRCKPIAAIFVGMIMVFLSAHYHGSIERLPGVAVIPFIRGADVSRLPKMEEYGFKF